jgi:hypothetical protein
MSYATQILYNNKDAFFPQPTPLIGINVDSVYYTELWTKTESFLLQGVLTGCDFATITAAQQQILLNFAQNYQNLVVQETDNSILNIVYTKTFVEIEEINFAESLWRGVLPYTIKMTSYPSGFFSGAYGIINPVDRWDYQEQQNLSMEVTHTVSAQGLSLSSGQTMSLNNVATWVQGRTGLTNAINPLFIRNSNTSTFYPTTIEEKIDRIDGNYSVIEKYTNDLTRSGYGLLRYNTNISSGQNLITVGINGTVEGGNRDITDVRKVFSGFSPFGAASNAYSQLMQEQDLNQYPLTQKIDEDIFNTIISFDYLYDNDPSPQQVFDYTVSLTSGNFIEVSIEGDVRVRGGDILQKYTNAINYAGKINLYQLCVPFYNSFYPYALVGNGGNNVQAHPLSPTPITSGMRTSLTEGTVSLFANFSNRDRLNPNFDSFKYSISVNPPVEKLDFKPQVDIIGNNLKNGYYTVSDLGYGSRTSWNIKGTALINESVSTSQGLTAVKQECYSLFQIYGNNGSPVLEREDIDLSRYDDRLIEFDILWTYEGGTSLLVSQSPYSTVTSLITNATVLPPQ